MARASQDAMLRRHLVELLEGGGAHLGFEEAIADLPADRRGRRPEGQSHTPWRLLEHMRLSQRDILDFSRDPAYEEQDWPDDYWPQGDAPPDEQSWERAVTAFRHDLAAMIALVKAPKTELLEPIPWGNGQTVAREAMLLADHNAYHLGQLVTVRKLLGAWA
ncbi:MAG: DinB family protein [Phycisphaeraceae bacterium]